MSKIIQFNSEKTENLLVEIVDENEYYEDTFVSDGREINKATIRFSKSLSSIKTVAEAAMDNMLSLPKKPSEFSIEFGLKISGKTNAIIASGSAEGNIKVTIKWSEEKGKKADKT